MTSISGTYTACRFSILVTFGHHLTCNDVGFLISVASMFFSNWCHFLKDPSFGGSGTGGRSLTPDQSIMAFRQVTHGALSVDRIESLMLVCGVVLAPSLRLERGDRVG